MGRLLALHVQGKDGVVPHMFPCLAADEPFRCALGILHVAPVDKERLVLFEARFDQGKAVNAHAGDKAPDAALVLAAPLAGDDNMAAVHGHGHKIDPVRAKVVAYARQDVLSGLLWRIRHDDGVQAVINKAAPDIIRQHKK